MAWKNNPNHVLYETKDADAPDCIRDRNGEVVLGLCRVCHRGEIELCEPCNPAPNSADSLASHSSAPLDLTAVAIGFLGAITTFGSPALIVWCARLNGWC